MNHVQKKDITVNQGEDFVFQVQVINKTTKVVQPLTGTTFKSQIKKLYSDTVVIASFVVTYDYTLNIATFTLSNSVSSGIAVDAPNDQRLNPTLYVYDVFWTRVDATKVKLRYGDLALIPRVTT